MIKAILFDMVGVLVFKKKDYSPKTSDEINAENIEKNCLITRMIMS